MNIAFNFHFTYVFFPFTMGIIDDYVSVPGLILILPDGTCTRRMFLSSTIQPVNWSLAVIRGGFGRLYYEKAVHIGLVGLLERPFPRRFSPGCAFASN